MKKKTVFLLACLLLSSLTANAQFGDVLRKAAQKAAQKTTEKLTDKAAEKAADAYCAILTDGNGKLLFEVFKYLGVGDIGYNQPKCLPYPTENPWA